MCYRQTRQDRSVAQLDLLPPGPRQRPAAANSNGEHLTSRFTSPEGTVFRRIGLTVADLVARCGPSPKRKADYPG